MTEEDREPLTQLEHIKKLQPIPLKQVGNEEGTSDIIQKADTNRRKN
jgi:hypothetical protein